MNYTVHYFYKMSTMVYKILFLNNFNYTNTGFTGTLYTEEKGEKIGLYPKEKMREESL